MACDNPLQVKVKGDFMPVPCGRCPPCKKRRVDEWVFRMMQEESVSCASHFVTLTYDTRSVPLTPHGFMTLSKSDFQNYMKRLRKLSRNTLKYYAVGEYGSLNYRPHYHALIFNCENSEYFADAWSLGGKSLGNVFVGTCTNRSSAYVLKYIDKESWREKVYRHQRDDRVREFSLCSKGLGSSYCQNPEIVAYHRSDLNRNYLVHRGGSKVAMPRYYRLKIFTPEQLENQHFVIESALYDADKRRRHLHLASGKSYTYEQSLEYAKQARAFNFTQHKKRLL